LEGSIVVIQNKDSYALLLLAGGKSSRMGRDKSLLMYQGRTFLDTLLWKGQQLGLKNFYISQHKCSHENITIVNDIYPDRGPIGGIHACMKSMENPYCLVVPVDVPQIPLETLHLLLCQHKQLCLDGTPPPALLLKHGDREEPLIGIYATSLVPTMEQYMDKGRNSLFTTLNSTGYRVCCMELPSWQVENINTPEAYEQLLQNSKETI
jgi:molybdopterin-guanine dinucleotide biosynthesis protein A